ncbi:MAG: DNA repair exonuclease [Desulfobacteraceae bacterium]|nr:MAG: DNA repair exonuclease [Desulfobacteraceae bacterium]
MTVCMLTTCGGKCYAHCKAPAVRPKTGKNQLNNAARHAKLSHAPGIVPAGSLEGRTKGVIRAMRGPFVLFQCPLFRGAGSGDCAMPAFVHAADIHLDSPLKGLFPYEGAPSIEEIRGATRQALDNLVNFVISEHVPLLLIAGDLYDGDWHDFNTGLYFAGRMRRLGEAGVRVAIVRGNHDAANTMTKTLPMPDNVKIFKSRRPETWILDDLGIAIHGQSYAAQEITDNLAAAYPEPVAGMLNIGLLHCLISGAQGHLPYAPCHIDLLASKGYDYWALGHVHNYAVLRETPRIVYSGCSQGRHIRETGPKGCVLVEAQDGALRTEFCALDVLRWVGVSADISAAESVAHAAALFGDALATALADQGGRPCCVRAILKGRCGIHGRLCADPAALAANIRAVAADVSGKRAWIEKVELQSGPAVDLDELARSDTPQGQLLRYLNELSADPQGLALDLDLTALKAKLAGSGVRIPEDAVGRMLEDARDLLLTALADAQSALEK